MFITIVATLLLASYALYKWCLRYWNANGSHFTVTFFSHVPRYPFLRKWPKAEENLYLLRAHMVRIGYFKSSSCLLNWWYMENHNSPPRGVIFYAHGIKGNIGSEHRTRFYNHLLESGFQVFSFDYRGFGHSSGVPDMDGVKCDTVEIYEFFKTLCPKDVPVILYGHSMGTGIILEASIELLKEENYIYGIVLEGTFCSVSEAVENLLGPRLSRYLPESYKRRLSSMFNNKQSISKLEEVPILFLHSAGDKVCKISDAERVYQERKDKNTCFFSKLEDHISHTSAYQSRKLLLSLGDFLEFCRKRRAVMN